MPQVGLVYFFTKLIFRQNLFKVETQQKNIYCALCHNSSYTDHSDSIRGKTEFYIDPFYIEMFSLQNILPIPNQNLYFHRVNVSGNGSAIITNVYTTNSSLEFGVYFAQNRQPTEQVSSIKDLKNGKLMLTF